MLIGFLSHACIPNFKLLESQSPWRTSRPWREPTDNKIDDRKKAPREVQELGASLTGKDANGEPLTGHQHAVFFLHFEGNEATRLCA